jgi:hypothetical protein
MLSLSLKSRVESLLGAPVVSSDTAVGGFSPATRERVVLADGQRAFVKAATGPRTAGWLRDEWRVYGPLTAAWLPSVLAWDEEWPLLILEDLGGCERAPPWTPDAVAATLRSFSEMGEVEPPPGLPRLDGSKFRGWAQTQGELEGLCGLGLCTEHWARTAVPRLVEAEEAADFSGESLLHLDVRGDNLFLREGRAVLVDWNWAEIGNPAVDRAFWAPSLQLDGGPEPEHVVGHEPELAAAVAGFFAWHSAQPVELASPPIRAFQLAQLRLALPWAARALGLPEP